MTPAPSRTTYPFRQIPFPCLNAAHHGVNIHLPPTGFAVRNPVRCINVVQAVLFPSPQNSAASCVRHAVLPRSHEKPCPLRVRLSADKHKLEGFLGHPKSSRIPLRTNGIRHFRHNCATDRLSL